jgi:hypothetical protein
MGIYVRYTTQPEWVGNVMIFFACLFVNVDNHARAIKRSSYQKNIREAVEFMPWLEAALEE